MNESRALPGMALLSRVQAALGTAGASSRSSVSSKSTSRVARCPVDLPLLAVTCLLLTLGLVMVASASFDMSTRNYGNPLHLLIRHGIYLVMSLGAALAALSLPIRVWYRFNRTMLGLMALLLCLVLVPGVGREVNGSTRWISLGFFSLQGSEFVKLMMTVYIAGYLVRYREEITSSVFGFLRLLLILTLVVTLLLMQPDFGAAVVIVTAALGVIYLAGAPWRFFLPLLFLSVIMVGFIAYIEPYRLARLTAFTDPWGHQFDSGYQLTQALIAFGRGEWLGLGLGNSIQKLAYLPEAHNDFLYSIIAEELGFAGACLVIMLYAWLVLRCLTIGLQAKRKQMLFHTYLAWGIGLLLGIQALVNLGVNLGALPTKGLTLPLMSYGGNSLIASCMMIAVVLRAEFEIRESSEMQRTFWAKQASQPKEASTRKRNGAQPRVGKKGKGKVSGSKAQGAASAKSQAGGGK